MKIGVIGIGDIARKAYLPIITRLKDVELYIYTRNLNTLEDIKTEYKSVNIVTNIDDLIQMDGVMIHAATLAHYELCKKFLNHNIPVFVDKPVSNNINEIEELFDLAKKNNTLFRVGFNRRYSTYVEKTKDINIDAILYQKNRVDTPGEIIDFIFDDFIHVVDTVLYYLKEEVQHISIKDHYKDGLLYSLHVTFQTENKVATLLMYRDSGSSEEIIELFSNGSKYRISDLNTMIEYKDNLKVEHKLNDWTPVLERRGFKGMIQHFIDDLRLSRDYLDHDDQSLITHQVCDEIYQKIK